MVQLGNTPKPLRCDTSTWSSISSIIKYLISGPGHRYPLYTSKKVYLSPKGHHHYPSKYFTHPKYHPVKYVATSSLPSTPTESPVYITSRPTQESTPSYTLNFGSEVRFPDDQESSKDSADDQKPRNTAPGDITRAIIRSPDVINNYDASLPIKVPRVKPFTFEVSDLIKNSDFHFAPGSQTVGQGAYEAQSSSDVLQYPQATSYQSAHPFGTHFATIPVNAGGGSSLDIYNMAGSSSYQSNQLTSGQDLEPSKTVKIPVAVIKGAHDLTSTGLLGLPTMRWVSFFFSPFWFFLSGLVIFLFTFQTKRRSKNRVKRWFHVV